MLYADHILFNNNPSVLSFFLIIAYFLIFCNFYFRWVSAFFILKVKRSCWQRQHTLLAFKNYIFRKF